MKLRLQFQRAFVSWLEENREHFAIQPQVVHRTDVVMTLSFDDILPAIKAELSRSRHLKDRSYGVSVWVEHSDAGPWLDNSICLQEVKGGYITKYKSWEDVPEMPEPRIYPSREALWRDTLFEPFRLWVNGPLQQTHAIALGYSPWGREEFWDGQGEKPIFEPHWMWDPHPVQEKDCLDPANFQLERLSLLRGHGPATRRRFMNYFLRRR